MANMHFPKEEYDALCAEVYVMWHENPFRSLERLFFQSFEVFW